MLRCLRRKIVVCLLSASLMGVSWIQASPASAQTAEYVFRGSGWGHGIGMSQYGAKGGAEAGRNYQQILAHYYQGTQVGARTMPPSIRIGLTQGETRIGMRGTGRFDFVMDDQVVASASANQDWAVLPGAGGSYIVEAPDGRRWTVGDPTKPLYLRYGPHGTVLSTAGYPYRYGFIELNTHDSGGWKLRALIHLTMDEYLFGFG